MSSINIYIQQTLLVLRAWLNRVVDMRWDHAPFGHKPHASRRQYIDWFEEARIREYPPIDSLEDTYGYKVDGEWLDDLALHTQITRKKSELGYPHGRLLYTLLRARIKAEGWDWVDVVETGTARGFSALCMARAISDSQIDGHIVTFDLLSHTKPQIWNCIDDHDGPKSRSAILAPWRDLTRKVTFIQADTAYMLPRVGLDRINFAFLDAQHAKKSVIQEFNIIAERQKPGDCVVFDDVTPSKFPGVVEAVEDISERPDYAVSKLLVSRNRGYAWAIKR